MSARTIICLANSRKELGRCVRIRAHFRYKDREYRLIVTDPGVERALKIQARRELTMVDTYLCVSLSEPYLDHWCYKLAAGILSKRPV